MLNFSLFINLLSYFLLRMSLAIYAAPFDTDIDQIGNNDTTNHIVKKRMANNKTQKRYPTSNPKENGNSERVMSVLQSINNLPDQHSELSDFNPLPPPASMSSKKPGHNNNSNNNSNSNRNNNDNAISKLHNALNSGSNSGSESFSNYNDLNQSGVYNLYSEDNNQNMSEDYYKRFIPNYDTMYNGTTTTTTNAPSYKFSNATSSKNNSANNTNNANNNVNYTGDNGDLLLEKLNYMIHLLEEQQDEKTNNVTEEVVLYSFLGIFIIFIVDSFAKVGKYTR